jgi:hypothetical protein
MTHIRAVQVTPSLWPVTLDLLSGVYVLTESFEETCPSYIGWDLEDRLKGALEQTLRSAKILLSSGDYGS